MPAREPLTRPTPIERTQVRRIQLGPIEKIELTVQHQGIRIPAVVNVFRIGDTLIDTGSHFTIDMLLAELADSPPRRIVLTHHHEDHVAGLMPIRRRFGEIPVFCPRPLVEFVTSEQPISPYRQYFWGPAEACPDIEAYDAGTEFVEDTVSIESIETPGHCPFHCGFIIRDRDVVRVLSGDLFARRKPLVIWQEASAPDAIASCRTLAGLAPQIQLIPSHRSHDDNGSDTLTEQADWIERESDRVHRAAAELRTSDPYLVAVHLYGPLDEFERYSQGQITRVSFTRSVLDPVRQLPPAPIRIPDLDG